LGQRLVTVGKVVDNDLVTLFLQRVFDALGNGVFYSTLAVALALVYRSSGQINFALGETSMVSVYAALILTMEPTPRLRPTLWAAKHLGTPWPLFPAIVVAVTLGLLSGWLIHRVLLRRVARDSVAAVVGATIGVSLLLTGFARQTMGASFWAFPTPFPQGADAFVRIGGARLWLENVGIAITFLVVLGLLGLFLARSRTGLAFRAVTSNSESAQLVGIAAERTLAIGWALAGSLGALAGVLVANSTLVEPGMMSRLFLFSLAAATIGGLDSPGGAAVGGVALAVVQTMASGYVPAIGGDISVLVAIAMLMVVLFLRPRGLFGRERIVRV
jgi:branched-chain amino acid transport system permease protein